MISKANSFLSLSLDLSLNSKVRRKECRSILDSRSLSKINQRFESAEAFLRVKGEVHRDFVQRPTLPKSGSLFSFYTIRTNHLFWYGSIIRDSNCTTNQLLNRPQFIQIYSYHVAFICTRENIRIPFRQ